MKKLRPKIIKIAHKLEISPSNLEKQITDFSLYYLHQIAFHNQFGWFKKRTKFYRVLLYEIEDGKAFNFTYDSEIAQAFNFSSTAGRQYKHVEMIWWTFFRKYRYVTYRQMKNAIYIYIQMNRASRNINSPLTDLGIRIQQYLAPIPYISLPNSYNQQQQMLVILALQEFVQDALNAKYYQLDKVRFNHQVQTKEIESSALYPDAAVEISIQNNLFSTQGQYFEYFKNLKVDQFIEWVKNENKSQNKLDKSQLDKLKKSPREILEQNQNLGRLYQDYLESQYKSFNEKRNFLILKELVTMNDHLYIGNSDPWADNDVILLEFEEQIDTNMTKLIVYKTEPKGRPHIIDMSGINYTAVNNLPYLKDFQLPKKKIGSKSQQKQEQKKESNIISLDQINRNRFKWRSSCKFRIQKDKQIKVRSNKLFYLQYNDMKGKLQSAVFKIQQVKVVTQLFHAFDLINFTSFQNIIKDGVAQARYEPQFQQEQNGQKVKRAVCDPWQEYFDPEQKQIVKYQSLQDQKSDLPVQIQRQKYLRNNVFNSFYVTRINSDYESSHTIKIQKDKMFTNLDYDLKKQNPQKVLRLQHVPGGISAKEHCNNNSNILIGMALQTCSEMGMSTPSRDVIISLQGTVVMVGCKGIQIKFQSF